MIRNVAELGADYFILKPFELDSLYEKIIEISNNNGLSSQNIDLYNNNLQVSITKALHELGFINWREGRKMSIGDTVYLFMSDERRIRFKTEVVSKDCKREDYKYWQKPVPGSLTFKLEFRDEYQGHELDEEKLYQHGFNGGRSIELPMCNNPLLNTLKRFLKRKDSFILLTM